MDHGDEARRLVGARDGEICSGLIAKHDICSRE
jgi:hypothetical protein